MGSNIASFYVVPTPKGNRVSMSTAIGDSCVGGLLACNILICDERTFANMLKRNAVLYMRSVHSIMVIRGNGMSVTSDILDLYTNVYVYEDGESILDLLKHNVFDYNKKGVVTKFRFTDPTYYSLFEDEFTDVVVNKSLTNNPSLYEETTPVVRFEYSGAKVINFRFTPPMSFFESKIDYLKRMLTGTRGRA